MTTLGSEWAQSFHAALAAPGRAPEIPEAADAYGWLIGSWTLDVRHYRVEVAARQIVGEVHFAWVLEGRAVQDVWILPRRADRAGERLDVCNAYGVSLRVWDAGLEAWRVSWFDPASGTRDELVGRKVGRDVVQVGAHADGTAIRWIFSEITADSFRWTGEALDSDGRTWRLEDEFRARRMG